MRILFALSGLHRIERGAEIAFTEVANNLARMGENITLAGSGPPRADTAYEYVRLKSGQRERFEGWPSLPLFRDETAWEDARFAASVWRNIDTRDFDVTMTCAFPWTNLALRRSRGGKRAPHVFVTQNGDWPAYSRKGEYRLFDCDGLICINPDYADRNREHYRTALIPNGADVERFSPGPAHKARFGIDPAKKTVLMVSAMIDTKNVDEGIRAVAAIDDAELVVAGDGPLRDRMFALADELMPGRFKQVKVAPADMPTLYRSADCFLHLSKVESFGNVYVEAAACGTPIVAYDLPRTRWILGDTATYAKGEATADVSSAILHAIDHGRDGSQALVARAADFAWSKVAEQYRDFFEEVVSS